MDELETEHPLISTNTRLTSHMHPATLTEALSQVVRMVDKLGEEQIWHLELTRAKIGDDPVLDGQSCWAVTVSGWEDLEDE